jgi:hypothetical protein
VVGARGTPSARVFDGGELGTVMAAVAAGRVEVVHRSDAAVIVRARPVGPQ